MQPALAQSAESWSRSPRSPTLKTRTSWSERCASAAMPSRLRRDPTDGLLHVQVGPFPNRNDAYAMRQKLLNDGYNAIVQP